MRKKFRDNYTTAAPPIPESTGAMDLKCKFCDCRDLRVCGHEHRTYLACPDCASCGPPGFGIEGAIEAYTGWPKQSSAVEDI